MLFLSQFLNASVVDSADRTCGTLIDMVATIREDEKYPQITAFVLKERGTREKKIIPFSYVANLGKDEVTLNTLSKKLEPRDRMPSDLLLYCDVVDKQIVDVEGTRVVRVNDLQFGSYEGKFFVLGIDVSTRGLLRRLGLDRWQIFSMLQPRFIDWQKIQVVGGTLKLATASKELQKLHPADLANIIEELTPTQSGQLLKSLDADTAVKVFEELTPDFRHYILNLMDPKRSSAILSRLPVDELTDYVKILTKRDRVKVMAALSDQKIKAVKKFLSYEDDTAGGLMSPDFVKGDPNWTVAEAREHVREISDTFRTIFFIYLSNSENQLLGVVSIRTLLIAPPSEKLKKIMKKVKKNQTVHVNDRFEKIAELMTRYNLWSVAVVDDQNKLVGIVTVDDVMRRFIPHA